MRDVGIILFGATLTIVLFTIFARRVLHQVAANKLRITTLEGQLELVGASVVPFNMAVVQMLVKELTHDHAPEADALMVLLKPDIINEDEQARLFVLLKERETNAATPSEREAAAVLPVFVRRAREEAIALSDPEAKARLRYVAVTPEHDSTVPKAEHDRA